MFDCFRSHGMKILWSLFQAPEWAGGGPDHYNVPDQEAWASYVRQVIEHYAYLGDNITFGIWNEPEAGSLDCPFWQGHGNCYGTRLFKPAAAARDSVNPSARLAGPEMGTDDSRFDAALSHMNDVMRPQDVITTLGIPILMIRSTII